MELNSNQIAELMPHRYPFALVDRITAGEPGQWAKGVKCVTVNEPFFCGHFPQEHVMPGVLILEAMAQVGCVAFLGPAGKPGAHRPLWRRQRRQIPAEGHTGGRAGNGVHPHRIPGRNWLRKSQGHGGRGSRRHSGADFCPGEGIDLVVFPKIGHAT